MAGNHIIQMIQMIHLGVKGGTHFSYYAITPHTVKLQYQAGAVSILSKTCLMQSDRVPRSAIIMSRDNYCLAPIEYKVSGCLGPARGGSESFWAPRLIHSRLET